MKITKKLISDHHVSAPFWSTLRTQTKMFGKVWATNDFLEEPLPDGIMYQHSVLELLKEVLCTQTTNAVVLGIFGAILLRKSLPLLGRQGSDPLREEILFRQPESTHLGDCPICCLPHPTNNAKSVLMGCCSKKICIGCWYADKLRQKREKKEQMCPFCRRPVPNTEEENDLDEKKRIEANDPVALCTHAQDLRDEGDHDRAFEYYSKAAALGDAEAHFNLSFLYRDGQGVKKKDEKKLLFHLEEAAIAGHPDARHNLACYWARKGRFDIAVKHFIIAANLGYDESLIVLKHCYIAYGSVSKNDFAAALRAHQAAVDATKSPQRDQAEKYYGKYIPQFTKTFIENSSNNGQ